MNELKRRLSEWVGEGQLWSRPAALGQGRAGLGAVQAEPGRQLWGLRGRDPQLGKASQASAASIRPSKKTKLDVSTHDGLHSMGLHVTHIKAR